MYAHTACETLAVDKITRHTFCCPRFALRMKVTLKLPPRMYSQALVEGMKQFGTSWKTILENFPSELGRRSQVNIKDKWRCAADLCAGPVN